MNGESEDKTSALQTIRGLRALVAPPIGGGNAIDWSHMTVEYDHGFPDDYQAFMQVYGEGTFDNFLYVNPPVSEVYPDPSSAVSGSTATARYTGEEEEFGEPELLIAWGGTVDADLLCWYASDPDPNRWTTVIWRRQWAAPESWVRFDCGMVELLCRYVQHEIPHFWIDDLRYEGSRFVHSRDARRWRRLRLDPWGAEPLMA
ncbi:hypothetical protein GCM10010441_13450 [Kitasatospora paracochleata]|uniref:SMI1/KNR4 family protein n=1 Tax=Kitasatospora paracochleata TaxID=58354 RepID=A0ABT1JAT0_9ACTN|nr:hypothetical protein [Kitasatospora paracochleata]MCP2314556.1 hypothetical protein [Kitasatospora paracochleata]